jgi:LacI family transcriptional regulator
VTLYDVARLAGVSIATVSRVVHGQDLVRDSTRARVLEVIEQLGYVPDGAAQSLSRRRKDVIGLVCVERQVPKQYDVESMALLFYDEIVRGVEALIRSNNWSLLITYLQEAAPDLSRLLSLSGKVDGLLIGEGVVPSQMVARLARRLPVVVISGNPDERAADVVTADNRSGAVALITHLVEDHGLGRLYHVEGPPTAPDARERSLALTEVLDTHPGVRLVGSFQGNFSVQSGEEAGEKLLATPADAWPDAVVCANDQTAIGVLQVFTRAGVRVPEQVAVVGFDDIYPGSLFNLSLTTVHQPMRLLGERACVRLLNRIAVPGVRPKVELLPTELVLRSSCGCPPGTETRRQVQPLKPARAVRPARHGRPAGTAPRSAGHAPSLTPNATT